TGIHRRGKRPTSHAPERHLRQQLPPPPLPAKHRLSADPHPLLQPPHPHRRRSTAHRRDHRNNDRQIHLAAQKDQRGGPHAAAAPVLRAAERLPPALTPIQCRCHPTWLASIAC